MNYLVVGITTCAFIFTSAVFAADDIDCITAFESPGLTIYVADRSPAIEETLTEILEAVALSSGFIKVSPNTFESTMGAKFPYSVCSARIETSVNNLYWKVFIKVEIDTGQKANAHLQGLLRQIGIEALERATESNAVNVNVLRSFTGSVN